MNARIAPPGAVGADCPAPFFRLFLATTPRRVISLIALGALATLALPPAFVAPVLFVSLPGLLWALAAAPTAVAAFWRGWLFGFGFFAFGLYWITFAVMLEADRLPWLVPLAVPALAAGLAFFIALAAGLTEAILRRFALSPLGRVFLFAGFWTLAEWVRGQVLTGFPWNPLGSLWAAAPATLQPAALVGVFGLSAVTALAAGLPAALANPSGRRRALGATLALSLVLPLALIGWGAGRLAAEPTAYQPDLRLRIVQDNVAQTHKWSPDLRRRLFRRHAEMSLGPLAGSTGDDQVPTLFVWPETAVPYALDRDAAARGAIADVLAAAARDGDDGRARYVLTGALRVTPGDGPIEDIWNSVFAIGDGGMVVDTYDKFHLVPFGEFMPLRDWLPFEKLTAGTGDFSRGTGPRTLTLPGVPPVGPLVCFEIIFPDAVVDPENRPDWLLNVTNDAWFGLTAGPYQHFAAARLRAVEQGLPVIRAANTGISAVIDPLGRIVGRLGLGETGVLTRDLPKPAREMTTYARWGDVPLFGLILCAILFSWRCRRG